MDKVWIGQVNTDDNAELAIRHGVHSFPTFLVFNNGKEVERFQRFEKKRRFDEHFNEIYIRNYL